MGNKSSTYKDIGYLEINQSLQTLMHEEEIVLFRDLNKKSISPFTICLNRDKSWLRRDKRKYTMRLSLPLSTAEKLVYTGKFECCDFKLNVMVGNLSNGLKHIIILYTILYFDDDYPIFSYI